MNQKIENHIAHYNIAQIQSLNIGEWIKSWGNNSQPSIANYEKTRLPPKYQLTRKGFDDFLNWDSGVISDYTQAYESFSNKSYFLELFGQNFQKTALECLVETRLSYAAYLYRYRGSPSADYTVFSPQDKKEGREVIGRRTQELLNNFIRDKNETSFYDKQSPQAKVQILKDAARFLNSVSAKDMQFRLQDITPEKVTQKRVKISNYIRYQ
jgi:hypothetical protein